jgi:hypothetical protein
MSITVKEKKMDIKKLIKIIQDLKEDCGDALLSTDIWTAADGQTIAGYNSNPKAAALMNRVGQQFVEAISGAKFHPLDKYYILDLNDRKMIICLTFTDYWWGILLDAEKIQLGLLLNVIVPKAMDGFNTALAG